MAEALFRRRLERDYLHLRFVRAASAGVSAVSGSPAADAAVQVMDLWGVDLLGHRAAVLTEDLLRRSDLVLAMAREHLLSLERMDPALLERSTTLGYLAERSEDVVARLGERTVRDEEEAAARLREVLRMLTRSPEGERYLADMQSSSSDIIDPFGSSLQVYISVAEDLDLALEKAMRALFGIPVPGGVGRPAVAGRSG